MDEVTRVNVTFPHDKWKKCRRNPIQPCGLDILLPEFGTRFFHVQRCVQRFLMPSTWISLLEQIVGDSYATLGLQFQCGSIACIRKTCLQTNIAIMSVMSAVMLVIFCTRGQGEEKGNFAQGKQPKYNWEWKRDMEARNEDMV